MNISKKTYDVLELAKQLDGSNYNEIHIKVYGIMSKVYEQGVVSGQVQMGDFIKKELLNKKEEVHNEEN